jgi:hypothetical protein
MHISQRTTGARSGNRDRRSTGAFCRLDAQAEVVVAVVLVVGWMMIQGATFRNNNSNNTLLCFLEDSKRSQGYTRHGFSSRIFLLQVSFRASHAEKKPGCQFGEHIPKSKFAAIMTNASTTERHVHLLRLWSTHIHTHTQTPLEQAPTPMVLCCCFVVLSHTSHPVFANEPKSTYTLKN